MRVSQLTLLLAIPAVRAVHSSIKHVLHEKRHTPSVDWVQGARVDPNAILPMRIGLAQNNLEKGYDYLMEVSHPGSATYGQYWTADKVHDTFAPSAEAVDAVRQWLSSAGINGSRVVQSDNKGWLAFDAYAHEAESLLLTECYEHEHSRSDSVRIGCDGYHVPQHLQSYIDYITPGVKLTPVVKKRTKVKRASQLARSTMHLASRAASSSLSADLQGCSYNMTPTCIKTMYSIPDATKAAENNSLGIYEQGDYFAESDLDLYYAHFAPWVPQGTYPIPALIDGANYSVAADNSDLNTGEADLDLGIAYSLIYPQSVTLYQVDDELYATEEVATRNLYNTFLDALDGSYCNYSAYGETGNDPSIDPVYPDTRPGGYNGTLQCGVYKPTNVISASYGQAEADLPAAYTKRQCNEFMKLGLQGHSVLVDSGDYGVASYPFDPEPNGCLGPDHTIFNPQYPSICPYVTSVGATMLPWGHNISDPEYVMWMDLGGSAKNFTSSGGFSNYFARPDYQADAVEEYFKRANVTYPFYSELNVDVNTTKGLYNRIGRGYPDVSANGANFQFFLNGQLQWTSGASLSAPLFASVLNLINEERLAIGKGPVGFVNPVLYAHPEVLTDITLGQNVGCGTQGFSAVKGWDPASGLGTPNYPKMKKLYLSLP